MNSTVALCISGQMRTHKKCYGYLKENVIEPLDPDIFIDTWEERGQTTKASKKTDFSQKIVTEETLQRLYSPKRLRIEKFHEEYFTEKGNVEVPSSLQKQTEHWKGNIPLFYKMKGCNEMKSKYEDENGFTYDVVIKIRPDLLVREELPKRVLENTNVLWHSECNINPDKQVSDKFAVSSSENMDYYTSVWDHLSEYWENPLGDGEWENVRVGERLMRHHMKRSDIEFKPFSATSAILRSRDCSTEKGTGALHSIFERFRR